MVKLWESNYAVPDGLSRAGRRYKETDWVSLTIAAEEELSVLSPAIAQRFYKLMIPSMANEDARREFPVIVDLSHTYGDLKEILSVLEFVVAEAGSFRRADVEHFIGAGIVIQYESHTWDHLHRVAYAMASMAGPWLL